MMAYTEPLNEPFAGNSEKVNVECMKILHIVGTLLDETSQHWIFEAQQYVTPTGQRKLFDAA
jgi:hypothetical protein